MNGRSRNKQQATVYFGENIDMEITYEMSSDKQRTEKKTG